MPGARPACVPPRLEKDSLPPLPAPAREPLRLPPRAPVSDGEGDHQKTSAGGGKESFSASSEGGVWMLAAETRELVPISLCHLFRGFSVMNRPLCHLPGFQSHHPRGKGASLGTKRPYSPQLTILQPL
jgi:hypothetical protein